MNRIKSDSRNRSQFKESETIPNWQAELKATQKVVMRRGNFPLLKQLKPQFEQTLQREFPRQTVNYFSQPKNVHFAQWFRVTMD